MRNFPFWTFSLPNLKVGSLLLFIRTHFQWNIPLNSKSYVPDVYKFGLINSLLFGTYKFEEIGK